MKRDQPVIERKNSSYLHTITAAQTTTEARAAHASEKAARHRAIRGRKPRIRHAGPFYPPRDFRSVGLPDVSSATRTSRDERPFRRVTGYALPAVTRNDQVSRNASSFTQAAMAHPR